jgi:organic radical activating enzyme
MFGDNPKRNIITKKSDIFYVKNIFKTIQGEGIFAGTASIFLRLGGCNLSCNFCDTEFEDFSEMLLNNILTEIDRLSCNDSGEKIIKLVVITGGEPMRQPIDPLCEKLLNLGYNVQIETNGTIYREIQKEIYILCSPKVNIKYKKYFQLDKRMLERIDCLKFLISRHELGYDKIPDLGITRDIPIFIQPMDEYNPVRNKENINFAVELCLKYGYRLSLQLHKILNIE